MQVLANQLNLSYNKGTVKAVKNVTFQVNQGELFGLIGPDGAGKSSIFRILTSLLLPDSGSATIGPYDVITNYKSIRKIVGYMPGKFSLYQDLTVQENLEFFASIFNTTIHENYELIHDIYIQLEPFKNRRAGKLSGGMKQKLALCCALIHKPEVLFLDEPTTGVDTVSRKEFWEMLKRLKAQNITILVSTPYMDEASLCDRIALIQNGEILSINTPQKVIESFPAKLFSIKARNMSALLAELRNDSRIASCNSFGAVHHITFKTNTPSTLELEAFQVELATKHSDLQLVTTQPTVEDCFINLINQH